MLREDESGTGGGKESSFNGKSSYFRNLNSRWKYKDYHPQSKRNGYGKGISKGIYGSFILRDYEGKRCDNK